MTSAGDVSCALDDQGITGFGTALVFQVSSVNGAGNNSINIGSLFDQLCFLSQVEVIDIDGNAEVGSCELINLGTWVLRATSTNDASAECQAICLPYEFAP